jgi:hypothetical protein
MASVREMIFLRSVHRLQDRTSVVPSSPILVTLMREALSSSETSVLTRVTQCNIPEDVILHSHRRENLKSYIRNNVSWCLETKFTKIRRVVTYACIAASWQALSSVTYSENF